MGGRIRLSFCGECRKQQSYTCWFKKKKKSSLISTRCFPSEQSFVNEKKNARHPYICALYFLHRMVWLRRMFCTAELWKIAGLPELPLAVPDLNRLLAAWGGKRDDDFISEGGKLQQRERTHHPWIVNYPSFEWKLELKEHHPWHGTATQKRQ